MTSRLAVSLAFILIGVSFTSHNTAGLAKLRSRTHKFCDRHPAQVRNCLTCRVSAPITAIKCNDKDEVTIVHLGHRPMLTRNCPTVNLSGLAGTISPDGKTIGFDSADASKHLSSNEGHGTQGSVPKLVGSDYYSEALNFVTSAARQIHEVLRLIRIR